MSLLALNAMSFSKSADVLYPTPGALAIYSARVLARELSKLLRDFLVAGRVPPIYFRRVPVLPEGFMHGWPFRSCADSASHYSIFLWPQGTRCAFSGGADLHQRCCANPSKKLPGLSS